MEIKTRMKELDMNQIKKSPPLLSSLAQLQQTINQLFDPTLSQHEDNLSTLASEWIPTVDVKDAGSHFLITADIPGVDPKQIDLSMDQNVLTIKGKKEMSSRQERKNYVRVERSYGAFYRSIALPELVDANKLSAKFKHGVLEIVAPKNKTGTRKRVKIKK